MTEDYREFKSFQTGPIMKDKKIIGHHFYEGEIVYFGEDDEDGLASDTDWYIYPDGTFTYCTQRSWESWDIDGDGTFDSSRFDEFVEQMMDCKTDWQKELKHNPWYYESEEPTDSKQEECKEEMVKEDKVEIGSNTEIDYDDLPF